MFIDGLVVLVGLLEVSVGVLDIDVSVHASLCEFVGVVFTVEGSFVVSLVLSLGRGAGKRMCVVGVCINRVY